jgi:hypothetical protein
LTVVHQNGNTALRILGVWNGNIWGHSEKSYWWDYGSAQSMSYVLGFLGPTVRMMTHGPCMFRGKSLSLGSFGTVAVPIQTLILFVFMLFRLVDVVHDGA